VPGKEKKHNHNPGRVELNNDNFKFNPYIGVGEYSILIHRFHRWLFKVLPLSGYSRHRRDAFFIGMFWQA